MRSSFQHVAINTIQFVDPIRCRPQHVVIDKIQFVACGAKLTIKLQRNTQNHHGIRKRVVGCRGGSRYVEGCWRFHYLKSVLVSWFQVSWFLGFRFIVFLFPAFLVPWFKLFWLLGFTISQFRRFNDPIFRNFNFIFLIDIDLISKIFKTLLDGSSGLFGARLFQYFQSFRFSKLRDLQHCKKMFEFFLDLFSVWGSGTRSKSRNHRNEGFYGSPISKSKVISSN